MFFSYSWCFVAARAACGHTKLIKRPRSAKPQPEYRLAQGIFRKRPVTALCFCLHLTIGQSPLFMRVCEGRKICPRKFKICPTYFELCALYFFFSQRGVKNTFHVLTLCPAPDSGFGMACAFKPSQTGKTCFLRKKLACHVTNRGYVSYYSQKNGILKHKKLYSNENINDISGRDTHDGRRISLVLGGQGKRNG